MRTQHIDAIDTHSRRDPSRYVSIYCDSQTRLRITTQAATSDWPHSQRGCVSVQREIPINKMDVSASAHTHTLITDTIDRERMK